MPTKNVVVTKNWTKIAASSDAAVAATWDAAAKLEVASTATDTAPLVAGHMFSREDPLTRETVGSGFIWAKLLPGAGDDIPLVVSTGTAAGGGGGATAAEIGAQLTATNANMEGSLQSIDADTAVLASTVVNGKQLIGGARDKWRDSFEFLDATKWDYVTGKAPNDAIVLAGTTQASGFMEVCLSAMAKATVTEIRGLQTFSAPYRLGYGASVSQRQFGEITILSVSEVDANGNRVIAAGETEGFFGPDLPITKISVTSNVALVIFSVPHNLKFDDLIVLSGMADNRMNVQARVTQIRSKYAVTIPLTFTSANYIVNGKANRIILSKGSRNCMGVALMDNQDANGIYFSRAQGSPEFISAASSFGSGYSAGLQPSAQPWSVNWQPRYSTEFVGTMDVARWMTDAIDSGTSMAARYKRSQAVPDSSKDYAMFLDVVALPNRSVPIEILSAVKTGTTTATITTVAPHGLATGAYVYLYGVRDQTAWANVTTATAVTVTGPSTLTAVWGTAVTATVYGGMLVPANGGYAVAGAISTAVQGACWHDGILYCGLTSVAGLFTGDVIDLVGVRDTTGAARTDMNGRFRLVAHNPNVQASGIGTGASSTTGSPTIGMSVTGAVPYGAVVSGTGITAGSVSSMVANTSITLSANATATATHIGDVTLQGVALEPVGFTAPANTQPSVLLSGGAVYRETSLRMSYTRCLDYTRTPVEVTGGHNTADATQAVPVQATIGIPVTQSSAGTPGTAGAGAWVVRGGAHITNDIPSAALTAIGQTTSGTVDLLGNTGSMQYSIDATAVSGTSRLITRVQGSFDGNYFVNVYDIGVLTNATDKNHHSPVIPVEFRSMRYVRDLRGTTPSVTHTINRVIRPLEVSRRQRRLLDRVLSLLATTASTEWLYVGGCTKAQLAATPMAGQSVAAVVKVQLCQGDPSVANNWYDIPGAPTLTTSAAAPVVTVPFDIGNAKFARLVPTTAGTGIVADTYELALTAWE